MALVVRSEHPGLARFDAPAAIWRLRPSRSTLDAVKSHFAYARGSGYPDQPVPRAAAVVQARKPSGKTDDMTGYTTDEISRLLRLSRREDSHIRRWLLPLRAPQPGLGSRSLRSSGGARRPGRRRLDLLIRPAEDGGRLKTSTPAETFPASCRCRRGFIDFVRSRGSGPLFYAKPMIKKVANQIHRSAWVGTAIGEWIRKQGFDDPTKAPNHAFRHYFKTNAHEVGVDPITANWLQGPGRPARRPVTGTSARMRGSTARSARSRSKMLRVGEATLPTRP